MLDFVKSQFIPVQHTQYVLKYWWSWLGHQIVPFIDGEQSFRGTYSLYLLDRCAT